MCRRVATQIEAIAELWEVVVIGRQVKGSAEQSSIYWIKAPRSPQMCNIKVADSGENLFPLKDEDLDEGLRLFSQIQTDKHTISTIMEELGERCGRRGTRPALVDEFPQIADGRAVEPSWARHFTALKVHESPFASSHVMTSTYGSGKHGVTHGALRLYSLVHIAVAVAIGLMGASVWQGPRCADYSTSPIHI